VALSSDGKRSTHGVAGQDARLWDAATGKTIKTFTGHTSEVSSVALSSDGKRVLTGVMGQNGAAVDTRPASPF